jgi:hypothetical protein
MFAAFYPASGQIRSLNQKILSFFAAFSFDTFISSPRLHSPQPEEYVLKSLD